MDLNKLKTVMDAFRLSGYSECRLEAEGIALELKRTVRDSGMDGNIQDSGTDDTKETAMLKEKEASLPERRNARTSSQKTDESGEADSISLVKASMAGTFYTAAKPGEAPYVTEGSRVSEGDTLGLLEAMKVISEITSPVSGTVKAVLVEDGAFAEYDTPLFRIVKD